MATVLSIVSIFLSAVLLLVVLILLWRVADLASKAEKELEQVE